MSRTYRKNKYPIELYNWIVVDYRVYKIPRVPNDKDIAYYNRDKKDCYKRNTKQYMKIISNTRRQNDKKELVRLIKTCNYTDYVFDDSKHIIKRKGIWRDIY